MKSVAQLRMLLDGTLPSHGRTMKRSQGSRNYSGQAKVPPEARPRRNSTTATEAGRVAAVEYVGGDMRNFRPRPDLAFVLVYQTRPFRHRAHRGARHERGRRSYIC